MCVCVCVCVFGGGMYFRCIDFKGNWMEKEMAIHSSILAWRIPWTEKPGGLQSMGSQKSDTT